MVHGDQFTYLILSRFITLINFSYSLFKKHIIISYNSYIYHLKDEFRLISSFFRLILSTLQFNHSLGLHCADWSIFSRLFCFFFFGFGSDQRCVLTVVRGLVTVTQMFGACAVKVVYCNREIIFAFGGSPPVHKFKICNLLLHDVVAFMLV